MQVKYSVFLTQKIGTKSEKDNPLLIKESIKRFDTYAFEPHDLYLENGVPHAKVKKVYLKNDNLVAASESKIINLNDSCLIHIRLDPPFDIRYLTALHIVSKVSNKSYVTNNPRSIIGMPEKIMPAEMQQFAPATLISRDEEEIIKFWKKYHDIIVKPLYDFGGKGVFRLKKNEENYKSILMSLLDKYDEQIVAQKYIPEVKNGDKRIMLLNGEIFGQILRVPAKGQLQASVTQGGKITKAELTAKEKEICKKLKPILIKNDIFLCGIDVIGDYLTEINITCPAACFLINYAYGGGKNYIPAEKIYWDKLTEKLKPNMF